MFGHIDSILNLKIMNMKKLVIRNEQGKKLFCRYEIIPSGIMSVCFYLPKNGFSVIWLKEPTMYLGSLDAFTDKRGREYTRVLYFIHPVEWLGNSFDECECTPWKAISKIAKTIKLL